MTSAIEAINGYEKSNENWKYILISKWLLQ